MLVELVHAATDDGLRLDGALQMPAEARETAPAVDAWLCLHGTGSNFYSSTLLAGVTPTLLKLGAAVLRANTRGHDLVSRAGTRALQGAAYERVSDSPRDLTAWLKLLAARGFRRVGVLGHSLGAVKGIYCLAQPDAPSVAALVAISPPRLSHAHFLASPRGEVFRRTYAEAERRVVAGESESLMEVTFPISYLASAAAYVDRYHADERYNVLRIVEQLTVPTFFTYGSSELRSDPAFAGLPEALATLNTANGRPMEFAVIAGADHQYTACHDSLSHRIDRWVRHLSAAS